MPECAAPLNKIRIEMSASQQIRNFLETGDHDPLFVVWPGQNLVECARNGHQALIDALIDEIRKRTAGKSIPGIPSFDQPVLVRSKVEPMVRGLFPESEQQLILEILGQAFVFLTPSNIENVLRTTRWLSSTWTLASIYLASVGAEPLSKDFDVVGYSEGTTCYVSLAYFHPANRWDDFVVHEAAHVFHNCKRETVGLPTKRNREWLLHIDFRKRETFAYASEAYSRLLVLGGSMSERRKLLAELEQEFTPADERVDVDDYREILREAVTARNGWKRILNRCRSSK